VSPTINVDPTLFVIPGKCIGGLKTYNVAITINCEVIFSSKCQSSMTIFHHKLLTREGRVLAMDELIHHPWQYLFTYS
jgi:hypothetical protein